MSLIVETGTGVADANTYWSLEDAQAYLDSRDIEVNLTEGLILRAMDFLDLEFKGSRTYSTQELAFPRSGIVLSDNRNLEPNVIPSQLKAALALTAYYVTKIPEVDNNAFVKEVKREKVDVIEREFFQSGSSSNRNSENTNPVKQGDVKRLLKYLVMGPTSQSGRLIRA